MNSIPPFADAQAYLESLMQAGQDAMKQFDDASPRLPGCSLRSRSHRGARFLPLR